MSQQIFQDINPDVTTGLMLSDMLTAFKDAVVSGNSGSLRPTELQAGGFWVDTTLAPAPTYSWTLMAYNGIVDIPLFVVNILTGVTGVNYAEGTYTVKKISADTVAAIVNLVKQRVNSNGQALAGDTLAEMRFVGRTATSTDPVVGYLKVVAADDQTTSASGVAVSLYSTPVGTNSALEHIKLWAGYLESVLPHKFNSLLLAQESIAGSSSMTLTSDKVLTEITGTTPVTIHGIEATPTETQYKIIVNATTQNMTIKSESGTASATERIVTNLAGSDLVLLPGGSATFFYSNLSSLRWKYLSGAARTLRQGLETISGASTSWVSPITGRIRVIGYTTATPETPTLTVMNVVAGTTYTVTLNSGVCLFGIEPLGTNLDHVTVAYEV